MWLCFSLQAAANSSSNSNWHVFRNVSVVSENTIRNRSRAVTSLVTDSAVAHVYSLSSTEVSTFLRFETVAVRGSRAHPPTPVCAARTDKCVPTLLVTRL